MEQYRTDAIRRRLDDEGTADSLDVRDLLDALDAARLAIGTPNEYLIRVARSIVDPAKWTAEHPVLRTRVEAPNPADAISLAGTELRRHLANSGAKPDPAGSRAPGRFRQIERAEAEAVATSSLDPAVGDAMAWALNTIDALADELREFRHRRDLEARSTSGDPVARSEMRTVALDRLRAAGVCVVDDGFALDGFDDPGRVGLTLPCLALAYAVPSAERTGNRPLPNFSPEREWFAISHRVEPRPMSRYEDAIVTRLAVNDDHELSLRRLAPRVRSGATVAALSTLRDLFAVELPDVDVDRLSGPLSPAWVELPIDSIEQFTAGTIDAGIALDTLVDTDPADRFGIARRPQLVWITEHLDPDGGR